MASLSLWDNCWKVSASSTAATPPQKEIRGRHRCTFKFFMIHFQKTGILKHLWLGVIIVLLTSPSFISCRPAKEQKKENEGNNNHTKLTNLDHVYERIGIPPVESEPYKNSDADTAEEEALGTRFEFQRKISSSSDANKNGGYEPSPDNLEIVQGNESKENPLLINSSMIVHVIVTSSSSSSSSTSSEVGDDEENDEKSRKVTVLKEKVGERKPNANKTPPLPLQSSQFNLEQSSRPTKTEQEEEDRVDLKRLPKSSQNDSRFPPDIFSAFYQAFSHNQPTSQPTSSLLTTRQEDERKFFSLPSFSLSTTDKPFNTFSIKPQFRTRPQHNLFLYQQRRRRLFRNRQLEERKSFSFPTELDERMLADMPASADPPVVGDALQEAERKLEQLARKLEESEKDKITPEPSTLTETTAKPSTQFLLSPSRIAVSVAVTHSKSVSPPSSTLSKKRSEQNRDRSMLSSDSTSYVHRRSFKPKASRVLENRLKNGNSGAASNSTRNLTETSSSIPSFTLQDRSNFIPSSQDSALNAPALSNESTSSFMDSESEPRQQTRKITRTVSGEIGDPSQSLFNNNFRFQSRQKVASSTPSPFPSTPTTEKVVNWQEPAKVWSQPAQVWGVPAKVWGEPGRVWSEPAKIWNQPDNSFRPTQRKLEIEPEQGEMQSDQPPENRDEKEEDDDEATQGTFVILGDDEGEGDSIDGELGKPLMLHHFTIPPQPPNTNSKTVSVSTSVSSSVSSTNKNDNKNFVHFSRKLPEEDGGDQDSNDSLVYSSSNTSTNYDKFNVNNSSTNSSNETSQKKSGKKFGYVIEGANVRKYRVEERTPDGYIVGEYGVLNNQNAFLRGVRYTADGTINPRLIHEALMKFLSLR